jgi:predicted GNAT family N-acyltransferase
VVQRDFQESELLDVFSLACEKLTYISPPERRELVCPVVISELRRQHEMRAYSQLRHRVYSVMGYIEEQAWQAPSRMEMDWSDTTAIHFGAFELVGRRRRLVGGARVVHTTKVEGPSQGFARMIASEDPVLVKELNRTQLALRLPIFHSARSPRLREIMYDVEANERNCGELSRVVVAQDHRGTGLAHLLVKYAIFKANELGVDPLLLECLPIHVPFYEKYGFRRISGEEGRVVGVGKSMVAMELTPVIDECFLSGADVYVQHCRLCACAHKSCYLVHYALADTDSCPLTRG